MPQPRLAETADHGHGKQRRHRRVALFVEGVIDPFAVVQEVIEIELEAPTRLETDNAFKEIVIGGLAVGSKAHDLAFIAVLIVADELADHSVDNSQGMGKENTVQDLDVGATAQGSQRRRKVAEAVDAQDSRLIELGDQET